MRAAGELPASRGASGTWAVVAELGFRRPAPRGRPSGRPFHASFVNVAAQAGLRAPVIFGDEGRADYILESIGCGVAFLDYDNDGWLDILLLTGRRRGASRGFALVGDAVADCG